MRWRLPLVLALSLPLSAAPPDAVEDPPALVRLHELGLELEELSPWKEGALGPRTWGVEHQAELEQALAPLAPWIDATTRALRDDAGRALAPRRAARPPSLGRVRNQVNVLCARALADARGRDLDEAVRRLDDACRLAEAQADGTAIGEAVVAAAQVQVRLALGRIADQL